MSENYRPFMGSLKGKIIVAFLLGAGAIGLALSTSYLGLNKMLFVVDDLAEPNIKLNMLNNLYRQVTQLEQHQWLDALVNPAKTDKDFLMESNAVQLTLDSLLIMPWSEPIQKERLLEMHQILRKRDSLFLKYLKLRAGTTQNKKLSKQFDTLSKVLSRNYAAIDSSVRTTKQKKTTISYVEDSVLKTAEPKRSFFSRLFKKKNPPQAIQKPKEKITEEVNITVDTLAIANRNNKLAEVNQLIQNFEKNELSRRYKLAGRKLALLKVTDLMLKQLVDVLRKVESEEVASANKNYSDAQKVFNKSVTNIMIILSAFSLGAAALIYLILIDISRSNYYRQQLLEAKNHAEELTLVKDRFLSNMSHEIRTPLQSIIGFSEQMLTHPSGDNTRAVNAIYRSSQHLLHIVNEVLDYSRLESGKLMLDKKDFYLLEVVEEVASSMQVQAEQKGLVFAMETETAQNEYVTGDPFRLQQILYNLLGNAIKFTHQGTVKLMVTSQKEKEQVSYSFEIVDTGIGIKPEEMDKIFHRFEQANASIGSNFGGTGLGLSIVKKLIDAQEGKLEVESKPDEGSLFRVNLTFTVANQKIAQPPAAVESNALLHVLVVDDDTLTLQLCKLILQREGVQVTLCNNPEELFEGNISNTITHVLMDIRMGKVSGLELAGAIRKKISSNVKLIAMSAHLPEDPHTLSDSGFDTMLRKPFREEDLFQLITGETSANFFSPPSENHFDLVKKMTEGDEALFQSVIEEFVNETEADLDSLIKAIENSQLDVILSLVHKLAGRTGQMGFVKRAKKLTELENHLRIYQSTENVKDELIRLCGFISKDIEETRLSIHSS